MVVALNSLMEREGGPLLVKLPRTPGRKDAEYMHLFCGPVDVEAHAAEVQAAKRHRSSPRQADPDLIERVERLEAEVAELREQLQALRNQT